MESQNNLSLLETLPQDMLGEILSRVASSSVEDISKCLLVSKTLASGVEDHRVFKELNLRPEAMYPLITFFRARDRIERCITADNPAAHYIEGIKQFFVFDNSDLGLFHLRRSAEGSYDNGTYLCGMLLLCNGDRAQGEALIRTLGWEESEVRADRAWREVRFSMRHVFVIMKPVYTESLRDNRPPLSCHKNDMKNRCPQCFTYKQMRKFLGFIM